MWSLRDFSSSRSYTHSIIMNMVACLIFQIDEPLNWILIGLTFPFSAIVEQQNEKTTLNFVPSFFQIADNNQ